MTLTRLTLTLALASSCGIAHAADDPTAGKLVFQSECAACHSLDKEAPLSGPLLIGVVGRKSAALDEFDYSSAMVSARKIWNAPTLNSYLANPQAIVPGTRMPYPGLANAGARSDLIAYLATLK